MKYGNSITVYALDEQKGLNKYKSIIALLNPTDIRDIFKDSNTYRIKLYDNTTYWLVHHMSDGGCGFRSCKVYVDISLRQDIINDIISPMMIHPQGCLSDFHANIYVEDSVEYY